MPRTQPRSHDRHPEIPPPAECPPRRRGPSADKTAHTQQQITASALALFLEQGITRTTMAQIAARAGVAKGTTYSYYPSKVDLLRGVTEHALAQSAAYQPLQRQPGETAQALLRRSLQPTMRSWEHSSGGALARLVVLDGKHHTELLALYKALAFDPWQRHVQQLLQMACDEGELHTGSVAECAQLLVSPFWMGMVHNSLLSNDPQQQVSIAALIDRLIALLFAAPAAAARASASASAAPHPGSQRKPL